MKWFIGIVIMLLAFGVWGVDFEFPKGSGCSITWDPNPPGEKVTLYRMKVAYIQTDEQIGHTKYVSEAPPGHPVYPLEVTCGEFDVNTHSDEAMYVMLWAYNSFGWGTPAVVTFKFVDAEE